MECRVIEHRGRRRLRFHVYSLVEISRSNRFDPCRFVWILAQTWGMQSDVGLLPPCIVLTVTSDNPTRRIYSVVGDSGGCGTSGIIVVAVGEL